MKMCIVSACTACTATHSNSQHAQRAQSAVTDAATHPLILQQAGHKEALSAERQGGHLLAEQQRRVGDADRWKCRAKWLKMESA